MRLYSGEAAVIGGERLFGCCPPAEGIRPEDAASSDERDARRRRAFRQLLSSGERMLAGGG